MMHFEAGLSDAHVLQMYEAKSVLTGAEKLHSLEVHRVSPLTPEILLAFRPHLDLGSPTRENIWAACLVGFFGLLRKSNLFPPTLQGFDPSKHLSMSDFLIREWGLAIQIRWSKTVQKKERVLQVPLLAMPGHPLCPVTAVNHARRLNVGTSLTGPAFFWQTDKGLSPVLYKWFLKQLRILLEKVGCDPSEYGAHSLRRGGASWAFRCGLPADVIKILGDWRSQAYQAYLEIPLDQKLSYMHTFCSNIPQ